MSSWIDKPPSENEVKSKPNILAEITKSFYFASIFSGLFVFILLLITSPPFAQEFPRIVFWSILAGVLTYFGPQIQNILTLQFNRFTSPQ